MKQIQTCRKNGRNKIVGRKILHFRACLQFCGLSLVDTIIYTSIPGTCQAVQIQFSPFELPSLMLAKNAYRPLRLPVAGIRSHIAGLSLVFPPDLLEVFSSRLLLVHNGPHWEPLIARSRNHIHAQAAGLRNNALHDTLKWRSAESRL